MTLVPSIYVQPSNLPEAPAETGLLPDMRSWMVRNAHARALDSAEGLIAEIDLASQEGPAEAISPAAGRRLVRRLADLQEIGREAGLDVQARAQDVVDRIAEKIVAAHEVLVARGEDGRLQPLVDIIEASDPLLGEHLSREIGARTAEHLEAAFMSPE